MNNKQFLNQRWKNTDRLLRSFQRELTGLTKDLKVDILDMFESVNVALTDLHKPILERDKERLNKSIKQWQKERLDNEYLNYKLSTRKRKPNYEEYLILMLLGLYSMYMKKAYETSKDTLKEISKDAYNKAIEEMGRQPKNPRRITWGLIEDLLIVNTLNMYLREYLELLVQTNQQEAYKIYLQSKQVSEEAKISEEGLTELLYKQQNRLINIRKDKESGVFVDVSHELWNEMYIEPFREENVQVRFIAEVDNATTMMCKGMDNMLFYTNDWNRYYRWSELDKRDVLYTTFGLKVGENLPPINNHFHWCRSTITYLTDLSREQLKKVVLDKDEKYAINKWVSGDFLLISDKHRRGIELTEEEKELEFYLQSALSKQPIYKGKAYRSLMIDDIDGYLKDKQVGDIFTEIQNVSYSTETGYNEYANVILKVNSKTARDVREYNAKESEVIYFKNKSFKVLDYYVDNGVHWLEVEEQ